MMPLAALFVGLAGLATGSFLNVLADRLPAGKSFVVPGSSCPSCGRHLTPLELVPVISFLVLRGRCRQCGALIGWRTPIVEGLTGILFAGAYLYSDAQPWWLVAIWGTVFLLITVIDIEHHLILDKVSIPASVLALVLTPLSPERDLASTLIGGALGLGLFWSLYLVANALYRGRPALGFGDVKLALLIGLVTGFPRVLAALYLGVLLGGAAGVILLVLRRTGRRDAVAYGPFLAAGAFGALVLGDSIFRWVGA